MRIRITHYKHTTAHTTAHSTRHTTTHAYNNTRYSTHCNTVNHTAKHTAKHTASPQDSKECIVQCFGLTHIFFDDAFVQPLPLSIYIYIYTNIYGVSDYILCRMSGYIYIYSCIYIYILTVVLHDQYTRSMQHPCAHVTKSSDSSVAPDSSPPQLARART